MRTGDEPTMIRAPDGYLVRAPWDFPNRDSALCRLLNKIANEADISICEDVPNPGLGLDYSYVCLTSDEIELWRWATADVD
jgi:hypothetical protein